MFERVARPGQWFIACIPRTGNYRAPHRIERITRLHIFYKGSSALLQRVSRDSVVYLFQEKDDAFKVHQALQEHTASMETHFARIRAAYALKWEEKAKEFRSTPKTLAPPSAIARGVEGAISDGE